MDTNGEQLELGRLGSSLGFLLRMAQIDIFDFFHSELHQHGMKPGEFSVLWLVSQNPGVRQGIVAKSLRIKVAHMTKLVRMLEERGLVTREIPDDDRRSVLLRLTIEGQSFVDANEDGFFRYALNKDTTLDPKELQQLVGLLQKYTGISGGAA